MIKGLIVSIALVGLCLGVSYLLLGSWMGGAVAAIVSGPFPVIGVILGRAGTRIRAGRLRKLFGLGLGLVYLTALLFAGAMILADRSGMIRAWDIPWSIFWLGSVGFVLYAAITVPVLLLGAFLIERWTRPLDPV